MTRFGRADVPGDQEWPLLSELREFGNGLESNAPGLDAAAAAVARLHQAAQASRLLPSGSGSQAELGTTGSKLEEECVPFDVEAGAAQLRQAAEARGLLSRREPTRLIGSPRAGGVMGLLGRLSAWLDARRGPQSDPAGHDPASRDSLLRLRLSLGHGDVDVAIGRQEHTASSRPQTPDPPPASGTRLTRSNARRCGRWHPGARSRPAPRSWRKASGPTT